LGELVGAKEGEGLGEEAGKEELGSVVGLGELEAAKEGLGFEEEEVVRVKEGG